MAQEKPKGIKSMTKPNSIQVRLAPGGKEFIKDTIKKPRKYKVRGE